MPFVIDKAMGSGFLERRDIAAKISDDMLENGLRAAALYLIGILGQTDREMLVKSVYAAMRQVELAETASEPIDEV